MQATARSILLQGFNNIYTNAKSVGPRINDQSLNSEESPFQRRAERVESTCIVVELQDFELLRDSCPGKTPVSNRSNQVRPRPCWAVVLVKFS
jgi:hypothetical protein